MVQMKQIIKLIKKSNRVAVFAHLSADADCLGSQSAISFLCKNLGKKVDNYIDDEKIASYCSFIDTNVNLGALFNPNDYDLLIAVDVAAERMLGQYKNEFKNHPNTIVIDHHSERDLQGKYTYVDTSAAACGEIIYDLIKLSRIEIDKTVATNLYSAIAGDTGCFMHDNTTMMSHVKAGELIALGADFSMANYNLFKFTSKKEFKLKTLLNNIMVQSEGVSYCIVEEKLLEKGEYTIDDVGDYVNTLLSLEGTKIAYLVKEKAKNTYSVSLRSLKGYDVSHIAQKFGGGGHKQASGFYYGGKLKDFEKQLLFECQKEAKGETSYV